MRSLWLTLLVALAYAAVGKLALSLALPPAYAAPIYPAAGIALAATLVYGRAALPGVLLGALIVNGTLGVPREQTAWVGWFSGLAIGVGAMLQAALGNLLVRRAVAPPRDFSEPRDALLLCLLGGLLACLLNASLAVGVLYATGVLTRANLLSTWLGWWSGDMLGVLLGTPIALALIGRPRAMWAPRRLTVALPLLLAMGAVAMATLQIARSNEQRAADLFERDASFAAQHLEAGLRVPLDALAAMHSLYVGSDQVTRDEFRTATEGWLQDMPSLAAIGYAQRIAREDLPAMIARNQQDEGPGWRVYDRADAPPGLTDHDTEVVAIRRIFPEGPNLRALGVNVLSVPPARAAIEQTRIGGRPTATSGFRLTQALGNETGVVIYRALWPATGRSATPGQLPPKGFVFVTLRTEDVARTLLSGLPSYLGWCLIDRSPATQRPHLGGAESCEAAALRNGQQERRRSLDFAGRSWELVLRADADALPVEGRWNLPLYASVGLLSAALLGVLLLTITGRTMRVEAAVALRTAALEHEVLERRRAEQALRESEQRWRSIVDQIPIGVVYADPQGHIRETNPRLCEMLGMEAAGLTGRSLDELVCPDDLAGHAELLRGLTSSQRTLGRRRQRLLRHDGSLVHVQVTFGLLRDAQGQPLRLTGVIEDITEHLRLADAEHARETAEAANRAKSEFLSRMSHELRTPLNAVLGFGQLLSLDRDPTLSVRQAEWVDQVQRAGWHLLNLINEMMDLSRIEAGELRLEIAATDPVELLRECINMIRPVAEARAIRLTPVAAPRPVLVLGDPVRLRQILTNLLSNAVKYNRERGAVHCTVMALANGLCEVTVRDEGQGLQPAELAHLFEPFNRLGRERSGIEGTGLGLVISRRLAEAMGSQLRAESLPGQGATFRLTLPLALQQPDAEPLDTVAGGDGTGRAYRRRRRLVYIEDNETNAEVMRGILARRPQIDLVIAPTGAEGLAAIRGRRTDLVLLDMHLPDMDGLDVLRELGADRHTEQIPVLAVSADATPDRIKQAFELGADDYATKPVDVATFLTQIDILLERHSAWMSGFAALGR